MNSRSRSWKDIDQQVRLSVGTSPAREPSQSDKNVFDRLIDWMIENDQMMDYETWDEYRRYAKELPSSAAKTITGALISIAPEFAPFAIAIELVVEWLLKVSVDFLFGLIPHRALEGVMATNQPLRNIKPVDMPSHAAGIVQIPLTPITPSSALKLVGESGMWTRTPIQQPEIVIDETTRKGWDPLRAMAYNGQFRPNVAINPIGFAPPRKK